MKLLKALLIVLLAYVMTGCGGFTNPISSETEQEQNTYNDQILFSGGSEHG